MSFKNIALAAALIASMTMACSKQKVVDDTAQVVQTSATVERQEPTRTGHVEELDSIEEFVAFADREGVSFVKFYAPWCPHSKRFAPIYEDVARSHTDVSFARMDIEKHHEVAAALELDAVPTIVLFIDGEPMGSHEGAIDRDTWVGVVDGIQEMYPELASR